MNEKFTAKDFELFFNNGGADFLYSWALMQFSEENEECYDLAVKLYELAAENGHGPALNTLGELYAEGCFVEKDTKKALDFYIKSAENGWDEAYCNLGYFYLYGLNTKVDYKKAFEYFSMGAMLGNGDSCINCLYELGDMYMGGSYVEENHNVAFDFYMQALGRAEEYECAYFLPDIKYRIGKCLYYGKGVGQDKESACKYLEAALDEYEDRINDPYNYREKRISEINDMIAKYTGICVATTVDIKEEK